MSLDALDPEADLDEEEHDYPYCPAVPGVVPHNFQAIQDLAGSGVWLWCTQCGEYLPIEGTGLPQNGQQPAPPPTNPPQQSSGSSPLGRITLP